MKLHLPIRLRVAVLSALSAVVSLSSTAASGAVAGIMVVAAGCAAPLAAQLSTTGSGTQQDPYVLTGTNVQGLSLTQNTYTADQYVTVDVNGGYLSNANSEVVAHLTIKQLILTNGNGGYVCNFNNEVQGDSSAVFRYADSRGSGQTWNFKGDLSQYFGSIEIQQANNYTVGLLGGGTVSASSIRVMGTLNVGNSAQGTTLIAGSVAATTLNIVQGAQEVSMDGQVTATTLSLGSSATLRLAAAASIGTLQMAQSSTVTLATAVTLTSGATLCGTVVLEGSGGLTVSGGSLTLSGVTVNGSGVIDFSAVSGVTYDLTYAPMISEGGMDKYALFTAADASVNWGDVLAGLGTEFNWDASTQTLYYELAQVPVSWDSNWADVAQAPAPASVQRFTDGSLTPVTITPPVQYVALSGTAYENAGHVAINLNGGGNPDLVVAGGSGGSSPVALDTWIAVTSGSWYNVVGGNYADASGDSFSGNTHIILEGATVSVKNIIGGNMRDGGGAASAFTGNTYITVREGNVLGYVLGASTSAHNTTTTFGTVDSPASTHLWVYTLLTTPDSSITLDVGNNTLLNATYAAVAGGAAAGRNSSNTISVTASSQVTVDLSGLAGQIPAGSDEFQKYIAGGSVVSAGISASGASFVGNTEVSITGVSGASFSRAIMGGSLVVAARASTHQGDTQVSVTGGGAAFNAVVAGGSYASDAAMLTHEGASSLSIQGADSTFSAAVVGGSYIAAAGNNSAFLNQGATQLEISSGNFQAEVVGAADVGQWLAVTLDGLSTVEISGGTFAGRVVGGVYVRENANGASSPISYSTSFAGDLVSDVRVTGGTFQAGADIIGGHYIAQGGDERLWTMPAGISVLVEGAAVASDIYGGSYIAAVGSGGGHTVIQRDISVILGAGAQITGNVYAAGYGTTSELVNLTTENTRVVVREGAVLGSDAAAITLSGGYEVNSASQTASVYGERTLVLDGASTTLETLVAHAQLQDFDVLAVKEAGSAATLTQGMRRAGISAKSGAGTLYVSGDMTSGGTSPYGLTLLEGTLQPTAATTLTGLVIESGTTLSLSAPSLLTLSGTLTLGVAADSTFTLDLTGMGTLSNGNYTLVSFGSSAGTITASNINDAVTLRMAAGLTGTLVLESSALVLQVSSSVDDLFWVSGGTGNWTAEDPYNFASSSSGSAGSATFTAGDNVTFASSAAPVISGEVTAGKLTLEDGVQVALTVTGADSAELTATGVALGTGAGFSKQGSGTLTLSSVFLTEGNAFELAEGTLVVADTLGGAAGTDARFNVDIAAGTVLEVAFTADTGNTLAFDSANALAGTLRVTAGSVSTEMVDGFGLDVAQEATVDWGSSFSSDKAVTLSGSGTVEITLGGAVSGSLAARDATGATSSLQMDNWSGTIVLTGTATQLNANAFGTSGSTIEFAGVSGTVNTADAVQANVRFTGDGLDLSSSSGTPKMEGSISGSGALKLGADGVTLTGDTSGYTGTISGTSGATLTFDRAGGGTSVFKGTLGSNVSVAVATGTGLELTLPTTIDGNLTLGSGTRLIFNGKGTVLTVDGDVDYGTGLTLDLSQLPLTRRDQTIIDVSGSHTTPASSIAVITPANMEGYELQWAQDGSLMLVNTNSNSSFYTAASSTPNGAVGGAMLDALYNTFDPQTSAPDSTAAQVMDALEDATLNHGGAGVDRTMAAISGASATALGAAFAADFQRQMAVIRNRTTTMGVDDSVVNDDMPYVNAWINAEGAYSEEKEDGTSPGYRLSSWGGTVGVDVDASPNLTWGLALSALYGDLSAKAVDSAEGDLDTYYLSAFARYTPSSWVHTVVVSLGLADAKWNRTVSYGDGSYRTSGDTDGFGFGLMYEVGYTIPMNEEGTTALQPIVNATYAHSSIGAYTESGSDLAIRYGDQDMDVFTMGVGLRAQTVIGENLYNRSSLLEGRVLVKFDMGDRRSSTSTALAVYGLPGGSIVSSEVGVVGVEVGLGLTVPLGQDSGSLFVDASLELRSEYTGANAAVGYRVNF